MAPGAVSDGMAKLEQMAKDTVIGAPNGLDTKLSAMSPDYKDVHAKDNRITTDYGVKQSNTENWLRVATEDKTGPMLLEDHAAREKVCHFRHLDLLALGMLT